MLRQTLLVSVTTAISGAGAGGCSAPPTPGSGAAVTTDPGDDTARTIAAMKPPRRSRPAIAVVAQNEGTETTDFIVPWAVLTASGAADVLAVAPEARAIRLTPALAIEPQATLAEFGQRYPDGADYVVVPKIEETAHSVIVAWIRAQAARGATIVGICSGVKTVAAAGLVDGRAATGHWYDIEELRRTYPTMQWVRDRRYVADRGVVTTTGVSASLPASLALVEAIAGAERAAAVAAEVGVASWGVEHDSSAFRLEPATKLLVARNQMQAPETWLVPVRPGVDEIALAFMADAWSRTFRSRALAVAEDGKITTRRGLTLLPDAVSGEERANARTLPAPDADAPAQALPASLESIATQYGDATASFVALQLEYAWAP
jgi:transcriptional regulator GlxA family with amidase domain